MDYRALLVKCMAHVRLEEGTNFTDVSTDPIGFELPFTEAERDALRGLTTEADGIVESEKGRRSMLVTQIPTRNKVR